MSSTCSQESADSLSDSSGLECEPSHSAKPILIAEQYSPSTGQTSLFTPTLDLFPGSAESMSLPAESLASQQALPESEKAAPTSDGYGQPSLKLFEHMAPRGSWQRILSESLASSLTDLTGSAGNFKTQVMSHGRSCSPLTMWVRHTSASESGLLPTPAASSYGTNHGGAAGQVGPVRPSLETMARRNLWPTPRAEDSEQTGGHRGKPDTLTAAARMWPTPTEGDAKSSGSRNTPNSKAHAGVSLTDAVRGDQGTGRMWPPPLQRDSRTLASAAPKPNHQGGENLVMTVGGSLNAQFVEWLMGFPKDWTEIIGWKNGKASRASLQGKSTESTDSEV
jgi:hypothetical protein